MRLRWLPAVAILALAAAACGGGGSSSGGNGSGALLPTSPGSGSGGGGSTSSSGSLLASIKVTLPSQSTAATKRSVKTIGTGTQSITFTLLDTTGTAGTSASPQTFDLTTANPACTAGTAGLTCVLSLSAPVGTDVFLAQTYTGTAGSTNGALTGSGAVQLTIALNAANSASLALDGQVASVYLTSASTYLGTPPVNGDALKRKTAAVRHTAAGTALTSTRVFVVALDSAGNTVINPSTYDQPITLQMLYSNGDGYIDSVDAPDVTLAVAYDATVDPSGCTTPGSASQTTSVLYGTIAVCSPVDTITATLVNAVNGAPDLVLYATIGATPYFTNPGPSPSPVPFPTSTPAGVSFLVVPVAPQTIVFTDAYGTPVTSVTSLALGTTTLPYYNTLNVSENGFTGSFTLGGNCAPIVTLTLNNSGNGTATLGINPIAAGTCTATVTDGTISSSLPITVTTTSVTGS